MEWLALSIFVCTVLFLVDRNHAWKRFTKWGGITLGIVIIFVLAYGAYSEHQHEQEQKASHIDWHQYETH